MTPRSLVWLAPILISTTLCAQFGRAPTGRAPAPAPARAVGGRPATPSPAVVGPARSPARMRPAPQAPSPFPPGTPSQAVSPLEEPAAAVVPNGKPPVRPVSPTLDTVAADPAEKAKALEEARAFRALKVPGKKVAPAVRKVLRLRWHKSLKEAAAKAREDHKPILWIQTLGDLRGYT